MTKQLTLDLAAALEDAQQGRDDGEMLIVRAGSAYMKVKAFNAGKHAAALRKIRKPRISKVAERRIFPVFIDGMSTAQYVRAYERLNAKFVREEMRHWKYEGSFFGTLPYEGLNESPCALYENGARDFDVIEEIDADDAQSVAAPEVQSAPASAVDRLYNPGTPDPKNSAALPELGGFRPGDVVDVDGCTIGRSTIELVFLRKLAGFDAEPLARIVGASGKRLDVQLFQLTRVEEAAPAPESAQDTAPAPAQDFAADIPSRLAIDAFSGTSFTPEKRGERQRQEYAASMAEALATLTAQATKGGTMDKLPEVFAKYRARQARAMSAYLASSSRCVSSMISGPSNFPAARMNKRADIARQRLTDYLDGGRAALRRAIHALRPDLRPIMAGDADAIERLQAKIDAAERNQAMMKSANAAIRKHAKAGQAHQVAALMELGLQERAAIECLTPDYAGRVGFPSYALTNNNANIRRMRERLEQITRAQAKPVTQVQSASGITLEDDAPANRVRIFFPGKPAEEVRAELKKNGFRWAPSIGAWQAYRNRWTLKTARELAGDPAQETPAAEIVEQAHPVAALEEVSPPCGDIAPAAQDVAESKAAAPELVDVLAIGASEVQALPEPEYLAQLDAMVGINYHTEALMMQCLRAGRDDLSSAIAHLVRHQRSDDCMGLTCVFIIARRAIGDMLAGRDAWEGLRDDARALLASWGLSVAAPSAPDTPCSGIAPASPEYVALRSAARVARRAALAAIDTARVSSAQALRELTADDADYSYLIPTDGTHRGGVHAAKNIRLVLKKKFPGVKFKVTSNYSRCSVKWTDGPTDAAVCEALAPFDIGASDIQSDYFYTVATRFSETYGGVQYLFTSRELSAATIQASITAIFGEGGPTPEEWKAGRAWSQVSGHGIYSSCAMKNEWEWLAMVRRHANGLDY